ncbi:A/G-specific adenine glycosylase [Virgibacillus dakarensis]|uniref:A/G-specific adenine glycosylase n=1 Tax=Virgibacillus dakarensis TaxID=1917889 RepID=UPI000B433EF8|nr:A/G-specific adenine glycosylase [Virgibacillus dakarensis]MTW88084.1 A/G-specific adenine glycosylase [Virgibacillus dakarensis]
MDKTLRNFDIPAFQQDLINWYQANKRDLPWRRTQDPYKIWVSEIMLQQTKVDTVIPYFQQFIEKYPTPYALAEADEQDVLKSWEGLGYYSRARNLQTAVREVVADYGGKVPDSPAALGSLKGVGPYTKGAILSIAYDQPQPAVDGNVMRVFARVLNIDEDIAKPSTKKLFEKIAAELISTADPSSFNQGVMELGALVCTPKTPSCMLCPVQEHCRAFADGLEQELPVKTKGKKQKTTTYAALLIKNEQNQYMIEKRAENGLLANLWQFPMAPIDEIGMEHITNWFFAEYGVQMNIGDKAGTLKHVFSHLIWQLEIFHAMTMQTETADERIIFVKPEDLRLYPFPVSHQKMLKYILD